MTLERVKEKNSPLFGVIFQFLTFICHNVMQLYTSPRLTSLAL